VYNEDLEGLNPAWDDHGPEPASLEVSEAFAMFLSAVHGCDGREFCVHLPILFFSIVDTLVAGFFPMMHDGTAQTVQETL